MHRTKRLCLTLACAGILFLPSAGVADNLETLMNESELVYRQDEQGRFLVFTVEETEAGPDSTLIVLHERAISGTKEDSDSRIVYLFTPVVRVPPGFKYSWAFLTKMAAINDDLLIGHVSSNQEFGVLYNSTFWLRTADVRVLMSEIGLAHMIRGQLRTELKPFVDEATR